MGDKLRNFDEIPTLSVNGLAHLQDVQLRLDDVYNSLDGGSAIPEVHFEEVLLRLLDVLHLNNKLVAPAVSLTEHGADGIVRQFYHF